MDLNAEIAIQKDEIAALGWFNFFFIKISKFNIYIFKEKRLTGNPPLELEIALHNRIASENIVLAELYKKQEKENSW